MTRRYSDLDDLLHDLDSTESLADDPFGVAAFDDDDLALLGSVGPGTPVAKKKAPPKRVRSPRKNP